MKNQFALAVKYDPATVLSSLKAIPEGDGISKDSIPEGDAISNKALKLQ